MKLKKRGEEGAESGAKKEEAKPVNKMDEVRARLQQRARYATQLCARLLFTDPAFPFGVHLPFLSLSLPPVRQMNGGGEEAEQRDRLLVSQARQRQEQDKQQSLRPPSPDRPERPGRDPAEEGAPRAFPKAPLLPVPKRPAPAPATSAGGEDEVPSGFNATLLNKAMKAQVKAGSDDEDDDDDNKADWEDDD